MKILKVKISMVADGKNDCKYMRRDTEQCQIGCKEVDVKKNEICPWSDNSKEAQEDCPCYE